MTAFVIMNFSHPFIIQPPTLSESDVKKIGAIIGYGIPDSVFSDSGKIGNIVLSGRAFINQDLLGNAPGEYDVRGMSGTEYDMYVRLYTLLIDSFIIKTVNFMPRIILFSWMPRAAHQAVDYLAMMKRCKKVVYYLPLFGAFETMAIKSMISANTVIVSIPLVTEWGRVLSRTEIIELCGICRDCFHTPLHVDVSIAACDYTRPPNSWNTLVRDVPIISANISTIGIVDSYFLAFNRARIMDPENGLDRFLKFGENHVAYSLYYMRMKGARNMIDLPTANDWQTNWLELFRAFGQYSIVRFSDIIRTGFSAIMPNMIVVVSDHEMNGWVGVLTFFAIRDRKIIDLAAVRLEKNYVLMIDLSGRVEIESERIQMGLKHCFVLTKPSIHLAQSLLQIELPSSIEPRRE